MDRYWISVREYKPLTEGDYLVTLLDGSVTAANYDPAIGVWEDIVEHYSEYEVTHWMEYPKPADVSYERDILQNEILLCIEKMLKKCEELNIDVDTVRVNWRYREAFDVDESKQQKVFGKDMEFGWLDNRTAVQVYNKKKEDERALHEIRHTKYARTITFYDVDDVRSQKHPDVVEQAVKTSRMKYFED